MYLLTYEDREGSKIKWFDSEEGLEDFVRQKYLEIWDEVGVALSNAVRIL